MIKHNYVNDLILKIAAEFNLPKYVVEEIVNSQFRTFRDHIINTDYSELKNIRYIGLGVFAVNERLRNYFIQDRINFENKLLDEINKNNDIPN